MNLAVFILFVIIYSVNCFEDAKKHTSTEAAKQFKSTVPLEVANSTENRSFGPLRKCCKPDEIVLKHENKCIPKGDHLLQTEIWRTNYSKFNITHNMPCPCSQDEIFCLNADSDNFTLYDNGSIIETITGRVPNHYTFNNFCVDYVKHKDNGKFIMPKPIVCYCTVTDDSHPDDQSLKFTMLQIAMSISLLFLTTTLCLYLVTPRLRKKLYDRCFLCHIFTLILAFSSLFVAQKSKIDTPGCTIIAYMIQFWFLASFFWLNVMCFDIWRSVGIVQRESESNCRKFIIYCMYAWGSPMLICVITICVNSFAPKYHHLRTDFGEHYCWFNVFEGKHAGHFYEDPKFIYFYSFISITLLTNVYMFINTALKIIIHNNNWNTSDNRSSRHHKTERMRYDKYSCTAKHWCYIVSSISPYFVFIHHRFFLYLKLFLVMGLNWFSEVISYYLKKNEGIWLCLDVMNMLQGIPIFVIFIWNPRVIKELKKRFWPRKTFLKEYSKSRSDMRSSSRFKNSTKSSTEHTTEIMDIPL